MSFRSLRGGRARFYKSPAHYAAAQQARGDYAAAGVTITIDAREIAKLGRALRSAGLGFRKRDQIMTRALNRGAARLNTRLKRSLSQWTGARQKRVAQDMTLLPATTGKWVAGVRVSGRHMRITSADFGARWKRSWPGGRHRAWNRAQTAKGSFMAFGGRGARYGGGLLFTRTSSQRLPIVPLWGPNTAREVERHKGPVTAMVTEQARWIIPEAYRLIEVELRRAKAKYGL